MKYIGIDVGNGFTKAVSDSKKIRFPSLTSTIKKSTWSEKTTSVGYGAAKAAGDYNSYLTTPLIAGKPVNRGAYVMMIREACKKLEITADDEFTVCAGLPYSEKLQKKIIVSMLEEAGAKTVWIIPQALGTAIAEKKTDCIVVSIGYGTTEYLAVNNRKPVYGISDDKAASFLISELESTGADFVKNDIFAGKAVQEALPLFVDNIENNCKKIQHRAKKQHDLILSGGTLLVPGLVEALKKHGLEFTVAENPVFSNAIGMHMYAREKSKMNFSPPLTDTANTTNTTTSSQNV